MNSKITGFLMFTIGAAVGSVVTWKLVKTKYERIAQEEIDSVKEVFSRRKNNTDESESEEHSFKEHEVKEYSDQVKKYGYTNNVKEGEPEMKDSPRIIPPEEFGNDGYDAITLNYYADGIIADDWDTIVIDPEESIGPNIESHFGEYEEDTVYVRNDEQKCDYEVCRDLRKFSEVVGTIDQLD